MLEKARRVDHQMGATRGKLKDESNWWNLAIYREQKPKQPKKTCYMGALIKIGEGAYRLTTDLDRCDPSLKHQMTWIPWRLKT